MHVLVPYISGMLANQTITSVQREADSVGWDVTWTNIDPTLDAGYYLLLRDWWESGVSFAVVEQDIEVPEGAFAGFDACPQPWCAHPYDCGTMLNVLALGCTRFRSELSQALPDALERAGAVSDDGLPPRTWRRMDTRLSRVLRQLEVTCHPHYPPAVHHHDYPHLRKWPKAT